MTNNVLEFIGDGVMKIFLKIIKNMFIFFSIAGFLNAETLELEDTSLHGKKDQPEAITFISVSKIRTSYTEKQLDYLQKSIDFKNDKIFNVIK